MSSNWLKKLLVAIGISASLQGCVSFSGTSFGKAVEDKGGDLIVDANQRIVRKKNIVDRFDLAPFKMIKKKKYLLVKVTTLCKVTSEEGAFKELTIQGEVPKGVPQKMQVVQIYTANGLEEGKENRKYRAVTIEGVYIPEEI